MYVTLDMNKIYSIQLSCDSGPVNSHYLPLTLWKVSTVHTNDLKKSPDYNVQIGQILLAIRRKGQQVIYSRQSG